MLKEFKEFAMKGNVLDMAIGIIIGAAFGKIITSLVADVIMPPIGLILGRVDFSSLFFQPLGCPLRFAGRRKGRWRSNHQLRTIFEQRRRFPDRCVCGVAGLSGK